MRRSVLVRLYPRRWRRRYEAEFVALLEQERLRPRLLADVVAGAVRARLNPYPASEEVPMASRRLQAAAALAAALCVLPAIVLLGSAFARSTQPTVHEPARTANAIVNWFGTLHFAYPVVLIVGPAVALALGALVVWRALAGDAGLRADVRLFAEASLRLLRRPALVVAGCAVLAAATLLAFAVDHLIAG